MTNALPVKEEAACLSWVAELARILVLATSVYEGGSRRMHFTWVISVPTRLLEMNKIFVKEMPTTWRTRITFHNRTCLYMYQYCDPPHANAKELCLLMHHRIESPMGAIIWKNYEAARNII